MLIGLTGISCCSFFTRGNAQDSSGIKKTDSSLSNQELRTIIIRAQKIQNQHLSSPTPVQILGEKRLKRINSFSVAEAIRYFSGVQLKDYGGIGGLKTINVRSIGTHHTTVFYNDIPISNAQNGQVDLSKFS